MKTQFENIGYSIEYYVKGKFIGSVKTIQPTGRVLGYKGRYTYTLDKDIVLNNGKRLKNGTEVSTMVIQLCGKLIKQK